MNNINNVDIVPFGQQTTMSIDMADYNLWIAEQ